jgi:hypothetical protein
MLFRQVFRLRSMAANLLAIRMLERKSSLSHDDYYRLVESLTSTSTSWTATPRSATESKRVFVSRRSVTKTRRSQ